MSRKRSLKIDFHVHSNFSFDSDISPKDIVNLAKKSGLDAVAITDHNSVEGGKEVEKLAGNDLIVFVGSEIKTDKGEIIGLNLKKEIASKLPLIQTCKMIKEQGGFLIVPHPFDRLRSGVGKEMGKIVKYIDAVEVFNARTLFYRFNKEALEFAEKHKLGKVVGSDAHFEVEFGSAYTLVDSEKTKDGILKAVREGKTKMVGWKSGLRPHLKTFVTKMGKRF